MQGQPKRIRILVVDDHPVATRGICMVIASEDDMEVCGTATTCAEALDQFDQLKPDMAIVDLRLGEQSGLDLVRDLLARDKSFPVLLFSMYDDHLYAERAIRAGARGYIMKHEAASTFVEAIRTVDGGSIYLRPELAREALSREPSGPTPYSTAQLSRLTDRELQVLRAIGDGMSRKEVATEINVSVKTLDGYRRSMLHKLELRDVTELAQLAAQLTETGRI